MAKSKPCDCPKCLPGWLAAFGDLMSLLLVFFVLLLSMSTMDAKKVQEAFGSLAGALSVLDGGTKTELNRERQQRPTPVDHNERPTATVKQKIQQEELEKITQMLQSLSQAAMQSTSESTKVSGTSESMLEESEEGFIIRLPANLLFSEGSATINNDDSLLFLKRIAMIVQQLPKDLQINAIGHTEMAAPAKNSPFKDNWELSTARAVSVVKELLKNGVDPKRIMASGRSSTHPLVSEKNPEGEAKNRRVDLNFFALSEKSKQDAKKSILDQSAP